MWTLADLDCKYDLAAYTAADGSHDVKRLAKDVGRWMVEQCAVSVHEVAALITVRDAGDTYFNLQADLCFGRVLPKNAREIMLLTLSFLFHIGERDAKLLCILSGRLGRIRRCRGARVI